MTGVAIYVLFTLIYLFFCACFVAPPTEFVSAGLTVQNILATFLGSEDLNFIYYHMRRTAATLIIHSFLPLGYYIALSLFAPQLELLPWSEHVAWQIYLIASFLLILLASLVALFWSRNKWAHHPLAKQLGHLANEGSWRGVASSVNIEFRRIDKFMTGIPGRRVIVTDSWVMKTSTYFVYMAHQNDIHMTLSGTEDHQVSYENMTAVQYLNMTVASINPLIKPFSIRLNSLEYGDLREKLLAPVRNARSVVIKQSLGDQFLESFQNQVQENQSYRTPPNMEVDQCIGCMQKISDVKLQKLCADTDEGECKPCFCRPMWCLSCMGKWFASRQNQQRPETWLGSRAPCPTCRANFCVLDVCIIPSHE